MNTCACGATLTGQQRRHCSPICRDRAYRERKNLVTLAFTVDARGAKALDMVAAAEGLTRSQALRQALLGYLQVYDAMRDAALARVPHEPSAQERAKTITERITK